MTDLTEAIAAKLDAARLIKYGSVARLVLMNHAKSGGYTKGLEVLTGWRPFDLEAGNGESIGQIAFEVCESETITAAMLKTCIGFAFLRATESAEQTIFYKVVNKIEPLDGYVRKWLYNTTPNPTERISI